MFPDFYKLHHFVHRWNLYSVNEGLWKFDVKNCMLSDLFLLQNVKKTTMMMREVKLRLTQVQRLLSWTCDLVKKLSNKSSAQKKNKNLERERENERRIGKADPDQPLALWH